MFTVVVTHLSERGQYLASTVVTFDEHAVITHVPHNRYLTWSIGRPLMYVLEWMTRWQLNFVIVPVVVS